MNQLSLLALSVLLAAPAAQDMTPALPPQPAASVEAMARAEGLLREAIEAHEKVDDYSALFVKQERIGSKLRKEEVILFKFQKPFKVYMEFIDSPDKGMEVIYVDGAYDNKLVAHLGGFLNNFVGTTYLDIDSPLVTKNNRHLITESGIGEFLKKYEADFKRGKEKQELNVIYHGTELVFGRKTHKVEARLPKKPASGYYCWRSIVYFDAESKLPIKSEFYDHQDVLMEKYAFKNLKINPKLTAYDFDPKNKNYNF